MPFQGNPNAGQPDPALLNLLFQQKAQREENAYRQQQDALKMERQAQIDAAKEARLNAKHEIDMLTARAGLVDKLRAMGPDIDASKRNAEQVSGRNLTEQDLLGGGGGGDFAGIVAQNDPTAVGQLQESNAAQANFATQLSMASELQQQLAPGIDRGMAADASIGLGQSVESERARKAGISLDKTLAAEGRANTESDRKASRGQRITQQNQLSADRLRDDNIISDVTAKALGNLSAVDTLQLSRKNALKDIATRKASGMPTDDLEERVAVINGRISAIKSPNTVVNKSPIPFSERAKFGQQFASADFVMNRIGELNNDFSSGQVVGGATGLVISMRERAKSLMQQAFQQDPGIAQTELGQQVQSALDSGETTIKVSDQLTMGLDQIFLAYAFSRMGRGTAKFTVQEMEKVGKQLDFQGVFTTPEQIRGALRNVAKAAVQSKTEAYFILQDDPDFREGLRSLETLPEDKAVLESLEGDSPGSVSKPPQIIPSMKPGNPKSWKNATPEELLNEFGN